MAMESELVVHAVVRLVSAISVGLLSQVVNQWVVVSSPDRGAKNFVSKLSPPFVNGCDRKFGRIGAKCKAEKFGRIGAKCRAASSPTSAAASRSVQGRAPVWAFQP
jgi:hypothetical protein